MTREEAIALLNEQYETCKRIYDCSADQRKSYPNVPQFMAALGMALTALRPVSREQVEKVFPGCEMCREKKKVKSDNFCGAATMQIVGDSIDLCGDKKKIKFFGHIYAPSFSVKFCPFCSRPLTDEAVQMEMERVEALRDET